MARADLRRARAREAAKFDRLLGQLAQQRIAELRESSSRAVRPRPPLLDYLGETRVPHIDRADEWVSGVTHVQLDFLERSTLFRWQDGRRQYGSCIEAKARRVFISSLTQRCFEYCAATEAGTRWVTICQDATTKADFEAFFAKIILGLPEPGWRHPWRWRDGRWEYVHERGPGGPETDIVSVYVVLLCGKTLDHARGLGRGGRMDGCHATEVPLYPHPQAVDTAVDPCIASASGQKLYESTFGGYDDCWFDDQWRAADEGRGKFLAALFHPWFADPLKRYDPGDPRHERAMAIPVEEEDLEAERRLGLDLGQVAFRRWNRCQGDSRTRHEAAVEFPEVPEDAIEREPDVGWLPRESIAVQEGRTLTPLLRAEVADELHLSLWDREPGPYALGVYRSSRPGRGRDYAAVVGIAAQSQAQFLELHGRCTEPELVRGLALALSQVAPVPHWIVVSRPTSMGVLSLMERIVEGEVEPGMPRRGEWRGWEPLVRQPIRWDFSESIWRPRRSGDGGLAGAPGWSVTGYALTTLMDRLYHAMTADDTPLTMRSAYAVEELKLLIETEERVIEGRPWSDLSRATALCLLGLPDVPVTTLRDAWRGYVGSEETSLPPLPV